jgi:3-isopropylmalate dehydrogenase
VDASPVKPDRIRGVDILVIRELTGGLYFGQPKGRERKDGHERAVDTLEYHDFEVRRVVDLAFRLAKARKKKVTSVDKANVLESSRLWRQIATTSRSTTCSWTPRRCGSSRAPPRSTWS